MSDGTDDPEVRWAEGLDPALTFTRDDVTALVRCIDDAERWNNHRAWRERGGWEAIDAARLAVEKLRAILPE